ncbi:hypothetical protein NHN26_09990 [Rhodovulum tesquicola]|uniref:hypothetical protein n=1 Tax=Rhodovulum tesquicola TaxID=540254 RepID=UPI0020982857|nr:hypothetical protein [Rhodovulum tesquicola]MCO8145555.1 hypothetical protein [Rhodovulum tesquicola]
MPALLPPPPHAPASPTGRSPGRATGCCPARSRNHSDGRGCGRPRGQRRERRDRHAVPPPRPTVPITLGIDDADALALAREIAGPILEAVRAIEGEPPELQAGRIALAREKALLFTRLCGSAYFGPTGCSGVVFALAGDSALPVFGDGDLFSTKGLSVSEAGALDGWTAPVAETGETLIWTGARHERR